MRATYLAFVMHVAASFFALSHALAAESDKPVLVRVQLKTGKSHVGELAKQDKSTVSLRNLDSGVVEEFDKATLAKLELPLSESIAARYLGLPQLMAWKIKQLPKSQPIVGKIAKITPSVLYLNLGKTSGIVPGQDLTVYRNAGEVIDPDTKQVLTVDRQKLAKLQVVEAAEKYSKARMLGELEIPLEVGDEVESSADELRVAVLPIRGGVDDEAGAALSEQFTTTLSTKRIPVVERALLDQVLTEQLLQNTVLFDEKTAQRIGKQLGATAVLTGRIVGRGEAHVRLIEVKSGRILLAASQRLSIARATAPEAAPEAAPKLLSAPESPRRDRVEILSDRALPGFFLPRDEVLLTKDGLVIKPGSLLRTKDDDFIRRDFVFEIVYTFGVSTTVEQDDQSVHIGIGDDTLEDGHPKKCIALDIRPTSLNAEGRITLVRTSDGRPGWRETLFGLVRKPGPHRIRIEKYRSSLTFRIDVDNDGETVDDLEMTIPDVTAYAPYLNDKNSYLYIGGGGVFTKARLGPNTNRAPAERSNAAQDNAMLTLSRGNSWPTFLEASDNALIGKDGLEVREHTYVSTKRANYVTKDFTFEVELVFPSWTEREVVDQIAFVGIGQPIPDQSPDPCVRMSIRPPDINDGHVDLAKSAKGTPFGGNEKKMTNLRSRGPHLFRMDKKGSAVTFSIDVEADGADENDVELTIPDITEYAPFLHNKNSCLFFGGGAQFRKVRLSAAD